MANREFSAEAEAAVAVVRAIVTSKKGACSVQSVLADFRELEGNVLLYKKFGYPNADEFLKASGEFVIQNRMGESVIFAKPKQSSAHIEKMVSAQRSTKTKKSGFAVLRQPQKRPVGNNYNSSAYNRNYSQMPYQTNRYPMQKKYPQQQQYSSSYQRYNNLDKNPNNPLKAYFPSGPAKYSYPTQNQQNNNQPKPLMSIKVAPPTQNTQNNRPDANNNNSAAKVKTGQQPNSLPFNDLRHKLNDSSKPSLPTQQQQRQPSSLELKNRANLQDQPQPRPQQPRGEIKKDALQKTINDVVASNQAYNASLPVTPPRSVNSRLQVTKDVIPTSEPVQFATPVPNGVALPRQDYPRSTAAAARPYPMELTPPQTPPVVVVAPLPTLPGRKTLQDRLKINQQVDSVDLEKAAKVITPQTPPPRAPDFKNFATVVPPPANGTPQFISSGSKEPFAWNDDGETPVEQLLRYAKHNGFERPLYEYFRLKNQRVQCRVKVNGVMYSTYPADFALQLESQFNAAQLAIDNIKRDEESRNYSVCLESDFEIANKIYELLLSCPSGMFSKKIPDAFREAHGSLLPDHWESGIMMSRPQMFVKEEETLSSGIYFANVCEENGSNTSEARNMAANVVALPWGETFWNLYVTNPVSTVEIYARLVGPEFSDRMDALSTEIELAMLDNNGADRRANFVTAGEYYLAFNIDWHRVRVDNVDFENNTAMCYFLDIGEFEKVTLDNIYQCESQFLELPAQAVCFTLGELEDFSENPKAKSHLENLLCGKVCVGQILTTKEDYDADESIKITLFDTSSDDDINLNRMVQEKICEDTPVPELLRKGVTTVIISYVDDDGSVFCQLKDTAMVYIQKLINNLVHSNALEEQHQGLYQTVGQHKLYLVRDADDNKWYRASLVARQPNSFCQVLLVDYGTRKSVAIADMFRMESLSVALCRYPPQAIRTKMADIPEVNDNLLSRLRALLKPGLSAMVKVVGVPQSVKIYMHLAQNNILVCVNDSIRAEMELEINAELISDYSGPLPEQRNFSSPVPSQVVPKLAKCQLPKVGDLFDVTVTIASSPNYFIVQPYRHAIELNRLMEGLQTYCGGQAQMVSQDKVQQGEAYAGFDSDDGHWYRILVVNVLCGPTQIHAYFCDFGKIKMLDSNLLRVLPQQFRTLPQQAVKAKIHGVRPRHGDWSTGDAVRFQQLTENKQFASYIHNIQQDEFNQNEELVELELIDVSTSENIMVHQILVDEGRAVLTSA